MVAQFTLTSDAVPAKNRLRAVRGTERLSQPYAFDLVVELPTGELHDLDAPVGQAATISFNDERGVAQDSIHGILATWELLDAQAERELYRARLVPRLWWLGQNRHSRVFVNDNLRAIIDKVLQHAKWGENEYRVVLKGRPGKGYPKLEHVCQYRESDLDFLSRWMEREGIYYYFEESPDGRERLVITDDANEHRARVAGARRYFPNGGAGGDRVEGFRSFRRTSHAQPAGVRLADFNYMNPALPIQHEEKGGAGEVVSLFGENLPTQDEAKWLTRVRTEELKAHRVIYRGAGRVFGIHPADKFSLSDHPRLLEEMLAVEVVHRGLDLEGKPGLRGPIEEALEEELDDEYVVEVEAIPVTVQYRPPRVTPAPRVTGFESAVVDGEANHRYAQLDEHGRYNVRLKFDESDLKDGRASTRLRMVQPHGGAEEGFHFPLRKGTEVMVGFVGGDPDRPIITGVSPNAQSPSLVTRANASQNVIQTGGGNKLVLEDTENGEWIHAETPAESSFLHLGAGQYNLELSTEGGGRIHTGKDLLIHTEGKRTDHVVQDLTETYDASQTTTVKSRKETVTETVTEEYGGHHQQIVKDGGVLREVHGREIEKIHDGREQTIDGGLEQTINAGMTQHFDNDAVKIEVKGGEVTITAAKGILLQSKGPVKTKGETVFWTESPARFDRASFRGTLTYTAAVGVTPLVNNYIGVKGEIHGVKTDKTILQLETKVVKKMDLVVALKKAAVALNDGLVMMGQHQFQMYGGGFTMFP